MPSIPKLTLRRDLARALKQGHPWLYRDALDGPRDLPTGSIVEVVAKDGRFLARGLYDAESPLAFRAYTLDKRQALDAALVVSRLRAALALRAVLLDSTTTNAYRWCNGEGDYLPGVVIDRYDRVAVLRLDGAAVGALRPVIVEAVSALGEELGLDVLIERARGAAHRTLWGTEPVGEIPIRENGVVFSVDVLRGQKTGFFLDQRDNRAIAGRLARGRRVANLFSYTGGFSVYAASGGATHVDSVDVAPEAIANARRNFEANGIDPAPHGFVVADVFDWLAAETQKQTRYGLMIVDPPSFAPSEQSLDRALAAYHDVFSRALALVEPGGWFCPASCSSHVTMAAFQSVVRDAASTARRRLQLVVERGQPADHPSPLPFTEGRYLKFSALRTVD